MQPKPRRWWPAVKTLLSLAILALIAVRFRQDLSNPELYTQPLAPLWLLPAAACYLGGLAFSAWYWRRLMRHLDQPAPVGTTLRAYFVGQLGKYVPGKALALVLRAGLMRGAGTSVGLAGLSAFYEVLVTMAAGALLALLLLLTSDPARLFQSPGETLADVVRLRQPVGGRIDRLTLVLVAVGLCAAIFTLVYPPVLNRLVRRVTTLFRLASPPPLRFAWLGEGLVLTAPCWLLFGAALAFSLRSVPAIRLEWTPMTLATLTAIMALAYVAGFIVPVAPGGLGVREFFLLELLAGELGVDRGHALIAAILLRLAWTAAELLLAVVLYFLPLSGAKPGESPSTNVLPDTQPPPREQVA